ncbi:MAG: CDGSH iron-sulfur domain-containing protein [Terracidiphilus sp.]|jgi:CDGSH-type Zn-finger protein
MSDPNHSAKVTIIKNGPYRVSGAPPLSKQIIGVNKEGESETWEQGHVYPEQPAYSLCRCGHSQTKPFCDGSHKQIQFDGTETASREPFAAQAKVYDGPAMQLADVENLCAFARYCDPHGQVWSQVEHTGSAEVRERFIRQTGNCPSGRLVAVDKHTGKGQEPELPVSIGLVEDPAQQCAGPIWLRGGIPVVSAEGFEYEVRNRVTLCRCGASRNKPFCDGSHASIKFRD